MTIQTTSIMNIARGYAYNLGFNEAEVTAFGNIACVLLVMDDKTTDVEQDKVTLVLEQVHDMMSFRRV